MSLMNPSLLEFRDTAQREAANGVFRVVPSTATDSATLATFHDLATAIACLPVIARLHRRAVFLALPQVSPPLTRCDIPRSCAFSGDGIIARPNC